jgi:hypothetical protein
MRTFLITLVVAGLTSCQPSIAMTSDFSQPGFVSGIGPGAQSFTPKQAPISPTSACHTEYEGRYGIPHEVCPDPHPFAPPSDDDNDDYNNRRYR